MKINTLIIVIKSKTQQNHNSRRKRARDHRAEFRLRVKKMQLKITGIFPALFYFPA